VVAEGGPVTRRLELSLRGNDRIEQGILEVRRSERRVSLLQQLEQCLPLGL
jgi:hypothetical protein